MGTESGKLAVVGGQRGRPGLPQAGQPGGCGTPDHLGLSPGRAFALSSPLASQGTVGGEWQIPLGWAGLETVFWRWLAKGRDLSSRPLCADSLDAHTGTLCDIGVWLVAEIVEVWAEGFHA